MSKPSPILNVLTLLAALENRPDGLTTAEVATALRLPTEDGASHGSRSWFLIGG